MTILFHHRTQGYGAEGVHITSIVKGFRKAGHDVSVCSPPGVDPFRTAGAYLYSGRKSLLARVWKAVSQHCPQILFELLECGYNLFQARRLNLALRGKDVAFIYERYAFFLWITAALARWRGVPLVVEVNEISGLSRARPLVMERLARAVERFVFSRATVIVTVSGFLKEKIRALGVDGEKIVVMPNAADAELFAPRPGISPARLRLGIDQEVVMGFVGWIDPWDNLQGLLRVFHELVARRADLRLLLIGDVAGKGVSREPIDRMIRLLDLERQVIAVRSVPHDQMPEYVDAMDICLIPDSTLFTSPVVLFEFMSMGKTVVAPAVGPIAEVIRHDETGLLFENGDPASFREALWKAVQDPDLRLRLGANARRLLLREHTWDRNAERVLELAAQSPRPLRRPSWRRSVKEAVFRLSPRDLFFRKAPAAGKVFLTFDDGPDPQHTKSILRILRDAGVKATFFMIGQQVSRYPHIAREVAAEGHELANHSWDHRFLPALDDEGVRRDIFETERVLEDVCAVRTRLYRPAYGRLTAPLVFHAIRRGMRIVLWSLDTEDDKSRSPGVILSNCRQAGAGDILLLHDDNGASVEALPDLIRDMRERGLGFGRIGDLSPTMPSAA